MTALTDDSDVEWTANDVPAALRRVIEQLDELRAFTYSRANAPSTVATAITYFACRRNESVRFVRAREVDWIEAAANYSTLHVGKDIHRLRVTFAELQRQLDARFFVRVHRSAIVNLERVVDVRRATGGNHVVILTDGQRLRISRTYLPALLRPWR